MDWNFLLQAIIAMVVITTPPDPVKILFFNSTLERTGIARLRGALTVAVVVLIILAGAALIGRQVLELLGIDLNAFSVVGGLVIASMGAEMLAGGKASRAQGEAEREQEPDSDDGLIVPLSIPLIAGPGAIVTAITITSVDESGYGIVAAVAGAAVVAVLTFASMQWLGGAISKLSERATALLLRFGGLLLTTIGVQMLLGGLKNFFA
jgi:multiple antibiotic resistance protein